MTLAKRNLWYALAAIPAGYILLTCICLSVLATIYEVLAYANALGLTASITADKYAAAISPVVFWGFWSAICATILQLPLYVVWVIVSSELSWKVRVIWMIAIVVFNVLSIPWFLWCKYRNSTREEMLRLLRPSILPARLKTYLET